VNAGEAFVPPGTGWPEDPAGPQTPVAHDAAEVVTLAAGAGDLAELTARQSVCRACPRLVAWREDVAVTRRKSFASERYWGRPIAGWGAAAPRIVIVGLAPAAHGGNRTGRVFTGDRSGDFLFAALHRQGLAELPTSVRAGDGQRLIGTRMAAVVRCAPPDNKPTPGERDTCAPWLVAELAQLAGTLRVIICLGGFAWQALWAPLTAAGWAAPRPRPAFAHGAEVVLPPPSRLAGPASVREPAGSAPMASAAGGDPLLLLGCYHPSQQNTFTGRVTPEMVDSVLIRAREFAGYQP
jgi:uracil-DNA glycosylase family 4